MESQKICSFTLVLAGETGKEIRESSRSEFLEKFSAENFALSDLLQFCFTSRPLNRGGIADLPLPRTILAILQKSKSQVSGK